MSDLPVAGLRNSLRFQAALPARIRHRPVMHAGRLAPLLRTPRDWSMKTSAFLLLSFLLFALSGCASLGRDYEQPSVVVTAFRSIPTEGMAPAFEVGLRIINPNPTDLVLDGIVYTISLEDTEVIKGVGRDFPVIEAYTRRTSRLRPVCSCLPACACLHAWSAPSRRPSATHSKPNSIWLVSTRPSMSAKRGSSTWRPRRGKPVSASQPGVPPVFARASSCPER